MLKKSQIQPLINAIGKLQTADLNASPDNLRLLLQEVIAEKDKVDSIDQHLIQGLYTHKHGVDIHLILAPKGVEFHSDDLSEFLGDEFEPENGDERVETHVFYERDLIILDTEGKVIEQTE